MPRRKFNRAQADETWKKYTENLLESINRAESEGLKKGYSSYEIEVLWQAKIKEKVEKKANGSNEKEQEQKGEEPTG